MSDDEVCRVLEVIRRDARCPSVSFTGGEPTLRPELPRFVRHAKGLGLAVNLISNGQRLDDGARRRRSPPPGLDSAQLSLEGPDAALHDALVGRPGPSRGSGRRWSGSGRAACACTPTRPSTGATSARRRRSSTLAAARGLERLTMNLMIPCGSAARDPDLRVAYSEIGEHVLRAARAGRGARRRAHLVLPAAAVPLQHDRPRPRQPRLRRRRRPAPRQPLRRRAPLLELRPRREPRQPAAPAVRGGLAVPRGALLPRRSG